MRFLIKASMATEAANDLARSGQMSPTIRQILDELKPEAAYFTEEMGERTALLIVDMADASRIPAIAEPWFLAFDARVEFHPLMTPEDLEKAGPGIEAAVKNFG